jgi:hypothetical protein
MVILAPSPKNPYQSRGPYSRHQDLYLTALVLHFNQLPCGKHPMIPVAFVGEIMSDRQNSHFVGAFFS